MKQSEKVRHLISSPTGFPRFLSGRVSVIVLSTSVVQVSLLDNEYCHCFVHFESAGYLNQVSS